MPPAPQLKCSVRLVSRVEVAPITNARNVCSGEVGDWSVVGKLSGISNRWRVNVVILSNLPGQVVLAVHSDAF